VDSRAGLDGGGGGEERKYVLNPSGNNAGRPTRND
jgi:hypothetical protein